MSYWYELASELKKASRDLRDEDVRGSRELHTLYNLAVMSDVDTKLYGHYHDVTDSSCGKYVVARNNMASRMAWEIVCFAESLAWQRAYLPTSD